MKYKNISISILITMLLLGGTGMNAFGLFWFAGTEKWKEEVQLSDGRVIVVDREIVRERGGGEIVSNRSGTKSKEYQIRFALPNGSGKIIEWQSTKKSPSTWPEIPLILDMESGQPIVFSIVYIKDGCEIYIKYVYRNGVWIEEPLPEKFEKRTTNLFLKLGINMPKFVDLETKRKANAGIGYRQSIRQVGPNRQVCG